MVRLVVVVTVAPVLAVRMRVWLVALARKTPVGVVSAAVGHHVAARVSGLVSAATVPLVFIVR